MEREESSDRKEGYFIGENFSKFVSQELIHVAA